MAPKIIKLEEVEFDRESEVEEFGSFAEADGRTKPEEATGFQEAVSELGGIDSTSGAALQSKKKKPKEGDDAAS